MFVTDLWLKNVTHSAKLLKLMIFGLDCLSGKGLNLYIYKKAVRKLDLHSCRGSDLKKYALHVIRWNFLIRQQTPFKQWVTCCKLNTCKCGSKQVERIRETGWPPSADFGMYTPLSTPCTEYDSLLVLITISRVFISGWLTADSWAMIQGLTHVILHVT